MTEDDIRVAVLNALGDALARAKLDPANLSDDFSLFESGLLDSFDFLNLIGTLEEMLGVTVDFDGVEPEQFTRLGGLIGALQNKRQA